MSTIIIIDPPRMAAKSAEEAEQARQQLIEDAKVLEAAGFNVQVIEPKCHKG